MKSAALKVRPGDNFMTPNSSFLIPTSPRFVLLNSYFVESHSVVTVDSFLNSAEPV